MKNNVRLHYADGTAQDVYFESAQKRDAGTFTGNNSAWVEYDEYHNFIGNTEYPVAAEFIEAVEKCESCGKNDATEPHTCPYAEEINNNSETLCNCCQDCVNQCAMDI